MRISILLFIFPALISNVCGQRQLLKLSDAEGRLSADIVADENRGSDCCEDWTALLKSDDVYLYYNDKDRMDIWIGKDASAQEKRNAMGIAHNYLMKTTRPFSPVRSFKQGKEAKGFMADLKG